MDLKTTIGQTIQERHTRDTREWCEKVEDVADLAECTERTHNKVVGVVESIKLVPQGTSTTLEITIYDGTDRIIAEFLGRRAIPGIDLGTHLKLEGTIGRFGPGLLRLINPAYELLPQYAG